MHTLNKEVSLRAFKALESKLAKSEQKTKAVVAERSELRAELRAERKNRKRITESRDNWKDLAVGRGQEVKVLKKRELRQENGDKPKRHHYPTWLITLVVVLRIRCGCSYGSIHKIIEVFQNNYLELSYEGLGVPHEKTLQNWVSKVGYFYLQNVEKQLDYEEVCLITDITIRVGTEKVFLALVCPYEKVQEGDLSYNSVHVVYLKAAESWTGDKIAAQLGEVLQQKGMKLKYMLSDEGNNLKRSAKLLKTPHLPDISHLVATCLKKTFSKQAAYQDFSKAVNQCQAKLAMGKYCYLRPPKQRVKARFLNQQKVVDWAEILLDKWHTLDENALEKLAPIKAHQSIIEQLNDCLSLANQISTPLKTKGLNVHTIKKSLALLKRKAKKASGITKTFMSYLKSYLINYQEFIQQEEWKDKTVHVCSDIIERLFGCYKAKLSDNYFVAASTIALELPLICLSTSELTRNVRKALEEVSMTNLKEWKNTQSSDNQLSMRIKFFKK